jgi:hypothetical protein
MNLNRNDNDTRDIKVISQKTSDIAVGSEIRSIVKEEFVKEFAEVELNKKRSGNEKT